MSIQTLKTHVAAAPGYFTVEPVFGGARLLPPIKGLHFEPIVAWLIETQTLESADGGTQDNHTCTPITTSGTRNNVLPLVIRRPDGTTEAVDNKVLAHEVDIFAFFEEFLAAKEKQSVPSAIKPSN